jgi:DNA-binding MarR family transcriptional regulator
MKSIDEELGHLRAYRRRSWAKLINHLKRELDHYMEAEFVARGYEHFKLGYMPLLMNIDPEGITNGELSRRASVTKQAMSKIVHELNKLKYITTEPVSRDGRSSIIRLTEKGKRFVVEAKHCMMDLTDEYKAVVGARQYEKSVDTLLKILEYHEERKTRALAENGSRRRNP